MFCKLTEVVARLNGLKLNPENSLKKSFLNSSSGKCFNLLIKEKTSCVISFKKETCYKIYIKQT